MTFDPTTHLARTERLGDPVLQSAWAGTEARQHLDDLEARAKTADAECRRIEKIITGKQSEPMRRIAMWRKVIAELEAAIATDEEAISKIDADYREQLMAAYNAYGKLEDEVATEKHRLRFMSELGDQCVKIAGECK
jgi:Mg2+ and Co2+ transporter CorA